MTPLKASIIRTVMTVIVGALLGWLATFGIVFDEATSAAIVSAVVLGVSALVTVIWYVTVRLIEEHFPQIGILLGLAKAPVAYSSAPAVKTNLDLHGRPIVGTTLPDVKPAADPFNLYDRSTYDDAVADQYRQKHTAAPVAVEDDEPRHRAE